MLSKFANDLRGMQKSVVVHRDQNTGDVQFLIIIGFDAADRNHQLRKPLEREEFALHRNYHAVACGHCIDGPHAQRRRTVNDDVIIGIAHCLQLVFHDQFAALDLCKRGICANKTGICGNDPQIVKRRANGNRICACIGCQKLKHRSLEVSFDDTNAAGCVTLRIKVDQKHLVSQDTE